MDIRKIIGYIAISPLIALILFMHLFLSILFLPITLPISLYNWGIEKESFIECNFWWEID